ncbi:MAG TPA: hypothetical protein VJH68_04255 [Candidatus Nanoarchaeia archaeon]|nr:hypothetical protein [Candidatus Nanoarchaeia archaeon]
MCHVGIKATNSAILYKYFHSSGSVENVVSINLRSTTIVKYSADKMIALSGECQPLPNRIWC